MAECSCVTLEVYSHPLASVQSSNTVPVELCLSFSFFFFLHFQGLKMRPRVASLLLRRMGGVWTPVTRQPVLSTLCWSTNSTAATVAMEKKARKGSRVGTGRLNWVRKEWVRVCTVVAGKRGQSVCCSRYRDKEKKCAKISERRQRESEKPEHN